MPLISGSNSVDAVQRSETNGGVATTKSRSKSNVACLGHFRSKLECYKPKNLRELEERIKDEWSKISAIDLQNLISSTTAVIKAKDGHTNY